MGQLNFFFFGNNRCNTTTEKGENVSPKLVFWLSFSRYGVFWGKNFKAVFGTPFPIKKVIFILSSNSPFLEKWSCTQKLFIAVILENIVFFLEKWLHEKYSKPHFLQKSLLIFVVRHTPPLKMVMSSCKCFFTIFQWKLKNNREVFLLQMENKLCSYKIFTKSITFWELQNECKNPSFLRKVICIRSDHAGALTKFHIHSFIL